jgi:hypothetical protein
MPRSTNAGALVTVAVALMFTLTSCVSASPTPTGAPSTPSPSTPADPTPIPTPAADPLDAVETLVVRPEALQLADADGTVVTELDYLSSPAEAITTLSEVFDAEPVTEEHRGSGHFPPSTSYRWGDFEFWEQHYVENWATVVEDGLNLIRPAFKVWFTGPEAMGLALTDAGDRRVGGSWDGLMSEPGVLTNPSGCSGPYLDFVTVERERPDGVAYTLKVSVDFVSTDDDASIERIGAPMPVYEDGCA